MYLVYLSTKTFPASTADHVYVKKMAEAFSRALPGNFLLTINYDFSNKELGKINKVLRLNLGIGECKKRRRRAMSFLLKFPSIYKSIKKGLTTKEKIVFISNDKYIISILAVYKLIYKKIIICSDWHILKSESKIHAFAARHSNSIIAVTYYLASSLVSKFDVDRKKIIVSHGAIDLSTFDTKISKDEARDKANLPKEKIILGYFGRFKTMKMEKGIAAILEAMKDLPDNFLFYAAGGHQEDLDFYTSMAKEFGVEKKVLFKGESSQEELALYQKACDMLLMPFPKNDHYSYYMSPMKMFEYMTSERPIITSDLPSVREILNESNALFVKPDDIADLKEKILMLSKNNELQKMLAKKAKNEVINFTWDKKVGEIISFLKPFSY